MTTEAEQNATAGQPIDFSIAPEVLNRLVVETIVKSNLGAIIERSVKAALGGYQAERAIEESVKQYIHQTTREVLDSEFRPQIVAHIVERLKAAKLDEIADKAVDSIRVGNY